MMSEEEMEDIEVKVKEMMGQKQVAVRGAQHLGNTQELRDLIQQYKEYIIELSDINDEYEGLERIWRSGRVISELMEDGGNKKLDELLQYCPDIDYSGTRSLYRWRYFYRLFPDKEYRDDFSWTLYTEFCSAKPDEGTKEAYEKIKDRNEEPPHFAIRTWRKFRDEDRPNLEEVARYAVKNGIGTVKNYDHEDIQEGIEVALKLLEIDENIPSEKIEKIKEELEDK